MEKGGFTEGFGNAAAIAGGFLHGAAEAAGRRAADHQHLQRR